MATPVIMPKIEMAQETATVIEWLKQEGERVEKGEPLLEVETDKVTMEVEAPASGTLGGVRVEMGEVVPVTEVIAYVLEPGEELGEQTGQSIAEKGKIAETARATPVARRLAEARQVDLREVEGSGPEGQIMKADVEAALAEEPVDLASERKVRATPAARRIARECRIDLSAVKGSGPKGRVQADDVRAYAEVRQEAQEPAGEVVPLDGMRRTIAERMTESYRTVPHITLTVRVDMTGFEETRAQLNVKAGAADQPRVSVTALLVKAVASTLCHHPWVNSRLREDEDGRAVQLLEEVNVGVAVALEDGLIVPVVHEADRKSVSEIATDLRALTERAREGRLRPSDVAGGTFTVSNLGSFGIEHFAAIINPPETAILAVGAIVREPFVDEADQLNVRAVMRMTLSADHRVVDGAVASRFLKDLREAMERPALLLW